MSYRSSISSDSSGERLCVLIVVIMGVTVALGKVLVGCRSNNCRCDWSWKSNRRSGE